MEDSGVPWVDAETEDGQNGDVYTGKPLHNMVIFIQNTQTRHPIAHRWRWGMESFESS